MNYFRKRRERKANLIAEFTVPHLIVLKFNMKLKKKLTMRFNMIMEV
ncbi:Uncharacterised protein [Streptococcus pneumoniae]|nr:Uncharacterised protein [Streptococcus pneumoniae]